MEYIIKVIDPVHLNDIVTEHLSAQTGLTNSFGLRILENVGMIVIETDDDALVVRLRGDSRVKWVTLPGESYTKDVESTPPQEILEPMDSTPISTELGNFGNGVEYFGQLELLNSINYDDNIEHHEYRPTKSGEGVDVYVIDTGINFNHPDLIGRVQRCPGYTANLDGSGDDDMIRGHGTQCALCTGGSRFGVAPDVEFYSLKVFTAAGSASGSNIVWAINSVIAHHESKTNGRPSIINYSLGPLLGMNQKGFSINRGDESWPNDVPSQDALKEAASKGVHILAAAGNGMDFHTDLGGTLGPLDSLYSSGQMDLSAEESGNTDVGQGLPIVVGALNTRTYVEQNLAQRNMADFSDFGRGVTISAPGAKLLMPFWKNTSSAALTYQWISGTSFSTPIVAGLIALRLEDKPTESTADTKQWLLDTANEDHINNLLQPWKFTNIQFTLNSGDVVFTRDTPVSNDFQVGDQVQIDGLGEALKSVWGQDYALVMSDHEQRLVSDASRPLGPSNYMVSHFALGWLGQKEVSADVDGQHRIFDDWYYVKSIDGNTMTVDISYASEWSVFKQENPFVASESISHDYDVLISRLYLKSIPDNCGRNDDCACLTSNFPGGLTGDEDVDFQVIDATFSVSVFGENPSDTHKESDDETPPRLTWVSDDFTENIEYDWMGPIQIDFYIDREGHGTNWDSYLVAKLRLNKCPRIDSSVIFYYEDGERLYQATYTHRSYLWTTTFPSWDGNYYNPKVGLQTAWTHNATSAPRAMTRMLRDPDEIDRKLAEYDWLGAQATQIIPWDTSLCCTWNSSCCSNAPTTDEFPILGVDIGFHATSGPFSEWHDRVAINPELMHNRLAFNPYQEYDMSWNSGDVVDASLPQTLSASITTHGRNEIPFPTTYELIEGEIQDWTLQPDGQWTSETPHLSELENLRILTSGGLVELTENTDTFRAFYIVTTTDVGPELDVTLTLGHNVAGQNTAEIEEPHTLPYAFSDGADRYYSCYWKPIKNLVRRDVTSEQSMTSDEALEVMLRNQSAINNPNSTTSTIKVQVTNGYCDPPFVKTLAVELTDEASTPTPTPTPNKICMTNGPTVPYIDFDYSGTYTKSPDLLHNHPMWVKGDNAEGEGAVIAWYPGSEADHGHSHVGVWVVGPGIWGGNVTTHLAWGTTTGLSSPHLETSWEYAEIWDWEEGGPAPDMNVEDCSPTLDVVSKSPVGVTDMNPTISITFNQDIQLASDGGGIARYIYLITSADGASTEVFEAGTSPLLSVSGPTLTISPSIFGPNAAAPVVSGTTFSITIGTRAISDLSGNFWYGFDDPSNWSFTPTESTPSTTPNKICVTMAPPRDSFESQNGTYEIWPALFNERPMWLHEDSPSVVAWHPESELWVLHSGTWQGTLSLGSTSAHGTTTGLSSPHLETSWDVTPEPGLWDGGTNTGMDVEDCSPTPTPS